jgi:hypothetical protein
VSANGKPQAFTVGTGRPQLGSATRNRQRIVNPDVKLAAFSCAQADDVYDTRCSVAANCEFWPAFVIDLFDWAVPH